MTVVELVSLTSSSLQTESSSVLCTDTGHGGRRAGPGSVPLKHTCVLEAGADSVRIAASALRSSPPPPPPARRALQTSNNCPDLSTARRGGDSFIYDRAKYSEALFFCFSAAAVAEAEAVGRLGQGGCVRFTRSSPVCARACDHAGMK